MARCVSSNEHYDLLIEEQCDPCRDYDILKEYMSRWDGPKFYDFLCLTSEKTVLEIGIGTGRIAQKVLNIGCKKLYGLDTSSMSLMRANENLNCSIEKVEFINQSIEDYCNEDFFDLAYSVLTFMHVEDKVRALSNTVKSVKVGGYIVLSISKQPDWLEYGSRMVKLFYKEPQYYIQTLETLGCTINETFDLVDNFTLPNGYRQPEYGQKIATLIKATRIR